METFTQRRENESLEALYDTTTNAKLLGRGRFSIVHTTTRIADNKPVVLKRLAVFEMKHDDRQHCLNEINLLRNMNHPHIIAYLDALIDRNDLVVVMELAERGDLAQKLRHAADAALVLDETLIWSYVSQLADALAYMHERRVMHRDIKPANVFIAAEHVLKLGDLGLGRHFSSKTEQATSAVGTPYYMSPECMQERGYDFKSDVWSLGCLAYELATLRSPFHAEGINFYLLGKRIMAGQYAPLGGGRSSALAALVDSMLRVDACDRPSARGVLDHIHVLEPQSRGLSK